MSGEASSNQFGSCRKPVEFHFAICDLLQIAGRLTGLSAAITFLRLPTTRGLRPPLFWTYSLETKTDRLRCSSARHKRI